MGVCGWKDLPPIRMGPCHGGMGGRLKAWFLAPCAVVCPLWRGRGKGGGGVNV